jgi:hypothetical protein
MPRLFETEEWSENLLQEKVRYYLDTMRTVDEVAREFRSREPVREFRRADELRFHDEVLDVRLEQFTEAMALLLVSDHIEQAKSFFSAPGWVLNGFPTNDNPNGFGRVTVNIRQFVGLSMFAALAKEGGMVVGESGLEYATSRGTLVLLRDRDTDREFFAVLPTLFSVAMASKLDGGALYYLSGNIAELLGQFGAFGFFERAEAQLLGVYRTFFESDSLDLKTPVLFGQFDGFMALRELERRYTNRIREMRSDRYHWIRMNAAGDLIDWALLIAQVAMLRRGRLPFLPENFPVSAETQFSWDLAQAMA